MTDIEFRTTEPDEFTIDGIEFRLQPLGVETAMQLGDELAMVFTPALSATFAAGAGFDALARNIPAIAGSVKGLEPFHEVFLKACKVNYNGKWQPLSTFQNEIFRRKHMRRYEWLAKCLELEFGDFLEAIGQRLGKVLAQLFGFPQESTGESGDAPSTDDAPTDSPQ